MHNFGKQNFNNYINKAICLSFRFKQVAKTQSVKTVTTPSTSSSDILITENVGTNVDCAKAEASIIKETEKNVIESKTLATSMLDTSATSTNEKAIAVQDLGGESNLSSKTSPHDSQMDTPTNEMASTEIIESKIDISENKNEVSSQMEDIKVETKDPDLGHSDLLPVTTVHAENLQIETTEHKENVQMDRLDQTKKTNMGTNEQTEDLPVNINEQPEKSKMDSTKEAENTALETSGHANESSLEEQQTSQPKNASKVDVAVPQTGQVKDNKLTDGGVAQLSSVVDTETTVLTGFDNEVTPMKHVVLENEPQQTTSVQDTKVTQNTLSPQSTINQNEVQCMDDLKVHEPVQIGTTLQNSDQNQAEKATILQKTPPGDDLTLGFPPVPQEILKALEAAVHQCRLQSSIKQSEKEVSRTTEVAKNSAKKDVSQVDRKVTNQQKTQVKRGKRSQNSRITRSQCERTESLERELSFRQRVKVSPKDGSPTTSNEGSSSSSNASRKTRLESSTVSRHSMEHSEKGYKVRINKPIFDTNLFQIQIHCFFF